MSLTFGATLNVSQFSDCTINSLRFKCAVNKLGVVISGVGVGCTFPQKALILVLELHLSTMKIHVG